MANAASTAAVDRLSTELIAGVLDSPPAQIHCDAQRGRRQMTIPRRLIKRDQRFGRGENLTEEYAISQKKWLSKFDLRVADPESRKPGVDDPRKSISLA